MVLMVVSVGTVMAKLFHEPKSERKKVECHIQSVRVFCQ